MSNRMIAHIFSWLFIAWGIAVIILILAVNPSSVSIGTILSILVPVISGALTLAVLWSEFPGKALKIAAGIFDGLVLLRGLLAIIQVIFATFFPYALFSGDKPFLTVILIWGGIAVAGAICNYIILRESGPNLIKKGLAENETKDHAPQILNAQQDAREHESKSTYNAAYAKGEVIHYSCPQCKRKFKARPKQAGKKGRCACGTVIQIPDHTPGTAGKNIVGKEQNKSGESSGELSAKTSALSSPHSSSPPAYTASSKQWYYRQMDATQGPIAQEKLLDLLHSGYLRIETPVWTAGMVDWMEAKDAQKLRENDDSSALSQLTTPIDSIDRSSNNKTASNNSIVPTGSQSRPWVRYWAKMLDFWIYGLIIGLVIGFLQLDVTIIRLFFAIFLVFVGQIIVEPCLLPSWGSTPGKALLNVRVRTQDGTKLSAQESMLRSLNVWIRGFGLGLPLVNLFTMLNAYNKLKENHVTSWDKDGGFVTIHKKIGATRVIIYFLIVFGFIALLILTIPATAAAY